jgi:glycosyltransferase involved in cell wall biosynthesis
MVIPGHKPAVNKERLLWLTDTFDDQNGVSMVLQSVLTEIKSRQLPIDLMVCSSSLEPEEHLLVVRPVAEFNFPFYRQQPIRVPNYLAVRRSFLKNGYTRVVSSTEGPMGMAALYLKKAFHVKTYFYLHTDWIMFAKTVMKMEERGLTHLRRLLRLFYSRYDGLFVLNTEQQEWLSGAEMRISRSRVFLTAHWVNEIFRPMRAAKMSLFMMPDENPVLLFAGRLSQEKGVMELPEIYHEAKKAVPGLKLVIAGAGPAETEMKQALPDAIFLGWVDHDLLPRIYASADLLILPSQFDTFSCVVLEALSCGLPVLAYETKGPRDILVDGICGFLVNSRQDMADRIAGYFSDPKLCQQMKRAAVERAADYGREAILDRFVHDIGLLEAC